MNQSCQKYRHPADERTDAGLLQTIGWAQMRQLRLVPPRSYAAVRIAKLRQEPGSIQVTDLVAEKPPWDDHIVTCYLSGKEHADMDKMFRAEGPMKLVLCGCGRLHVTCGQVTFHFHREEFLAFADGVGRLAALVKQPPAGLGSVSGAGAHTEVCH
jgi:hypothetical protein